MPAPFFAGAPAWKPALEGDLHFEATSTVLPPPTETLVDSIPDDFDPDEILEAPVVPSPVVAAPVETVEPPKKAKEAKAVLAPMARRIPALLVDLLPVAGALMLTLLALERKLEAGGAPLLPSSMHALGRMFWALGPSVWILAAVIVLVPIVYQTLALAFMGGSVGDMLFGIRWITRHGERPGITRSLLRSLLAVPSWALALSGALLALVTRSRRTFYDIATGCYPVLK